MRSWNLTIVRSERFSRPWLIRMSFRYVNFASFILLVGFQLNMTLSSLNYPALQNISNFLWQYGSAAFYTKNILLRIQVNPLVFAIIYLFLVHKHTLFLVAYAKPLMMALPHNITQAYTRSDQYNVRKACRHSQNTQKLQKYLLLSIHQHITTLSNNRSEFYKFHANCSGKLLDFWKIGQQFLQPSF